MRLTLPLGLLALLAAACAGDGSGVGPDLSAEEAWYRAAPKTILVLPAENKTSAADADVLFMSTIARPLVDRGYYVIPPEITADLLRREGIHGAESWEIPPRRLLDYFGADAVLYVVIEEWDTSWILIHSRVAVTLDYRLVSTRTGETIWTDHRVLARQSGSNLNTSDPLVYLIASTIDATVTAISTSYVDLAEQANGLATGGLYPGARHPGYAARQEEIAVWRKAMDERERRESGEEKSAPKPSGPEASGRTPDSP